MWGQHCFFALEHLTHPACYSDPWQLATAMASAIESPYATKVDT